MSRRRRGNENNTIILPALINPAIQPLPTNSHAVSSVRIVYARDDEYARFTSASRAFSPRPGRNAYIV